MALKKVILRQKGSFNSMGGGDINKNFLEIGLRLKALDGIDTAPIFLSPIADDVHAAGSAYAYDVSGHFAGGALTFTAVGLAAGFAINSSSGVISKATPLEGEDSTAVKVTATNAAGAVGSNAFSITITA